MSRKITAPDPESRARKIQDNLFRQMKDREKREAQRGKRSARSKSRTKWSKEKLRRELEDMDSQIEEEARIDRLRAFDSQNSPEPDSHHYNTPIDPGLDYLELNSLKKKRGHHIYSNRQINSPSNNGSERWQQPVKGKRSSRQKKNLHRDFQRDANPTRKISDFALHEDAARVSARGPKSRRSSRGRKHHHRRVSSNLEDLNRYREFKQNDFRRTTNLADQIQSKRDSYGTRKLRGKKSRGLQPDLGLSYQGKMSDLNIAERDVSSRRKGDRQKYQGQNNVEAFAKRRRSRNSSRKRYFDDEESEEEAHYFQSMANNSRMNFDYGNIDRTSQMDLPFD